MNGRIVEIAADGRYIRAERGFMVVSESGAEVGRIPIDQVDAVIGNAHGLVWSNEILVRLAERAAPLVLVNRQHSPVGVLIGLDGNHRQGARMALQARATRALRGRLWKAIVQSKLRAQARTLEAFGAPGARLRRLAGEVRSGDPSNLEAQGAHVYWPLLFGVDFRRDTSGDGANALLNYGYTILRAAVTRAIVAAGLHPCLGIKHCSEFNGAALADDLMEPYRPVFDACVSSLLARGVAKVDVDARRVLALCLYRNIASDAGLSPIGTSIERLAVSCAQIFEGERTRLELPGEMVPEALSGLGRANEVVFEG